MKKSKLFLSLAIVGVLSAVLAPATSQASDHTQSVRVSSYASPEVNEAATAYVALFKATIEESVAKREYQEKMAYKSMSAEACLNARSKRLLAKEVSQEEKDALILAHVSTEQLNAYRDLAKGQIFRVNSLEILTCDVAGLKVYAKRAI